MLSHQKKVDATTRLGRLLMSESMGVGYDLKCENISLLKFRILSIEQDFCWVKKQPYELLALSQISDELHMWENLWKIYFLPFGKSWGIGKSRTFWDVGTLRHMITTAFVCAFVAFICLSYELWSSETVVTLWWWAEWKLKRGGASILPIKTYFLRCWYTMPASCQ